jgi:hypothetical protein
VTASEFVDRLAACSPTYQQITAKVPAIRDDVWSNFHVKPKGSNVNDSGRPIQDLLLHYHTSGVTFGIVSLLDQLIESVNPDLKLFADFYSDSCAINVRTGYVLWCDPEGQVIGDAAYSESQFLNALLITAEYEAQWIKGDIGDDDEQAPREYTQKCIEAAGGQSCRLFYEAILL